MKWSFKNVINFIRRKNKNKNKSACFEFPSSHYTIYRPEERI